ncbi:MAG: hypothetical protein ACFFAS_01845 [Promethearchaeota archaeon]
MSGLVGKWVLVRRENYEEYVFSVMGIKTRQKSKKIKKGNIKQFIEQDGIKFTINDQIKAPIGTIIEIKNEYIADGMTQTEEKRPPDISRKCITSFKDDVLVIKSNDGKHDLMTQRFIENGMLVQINTNLTKNVSTRQYFEKL